MRGSDMIGVAGHAIANHFAIDFGAARLGMFIFFQADDACALAHHKAVAVLVIGPGCGGRIVVALGRQSLGLSKTGDSDRTDGRFRATGQHHIGVIESDHPRGITNTVSAGRTGSHNRVIRSHQTIFDRNLARNEIDQPSVDKMRADPARSAFV